ncbi:MAG: DNA replication/repair protein RecF [Epulopiscium sp. Nele67-Bin005]|nr:MAG: DNA replication/repair protein RecF [Epulopiscium sp. Nele67-Bin005]
MYIKMLTLNQFRNYNQAQIELCNGINILMGDNAQGKTNILEAIYLCATARSHRTSREKEVIRWSKMQSNIQLEVQKSTINHKIDFQIAESGKRVLINKLPVIKLGELFGVLNVVMFSPEDLQLIKKSPKERRRFLDIELCQFDKLYYHSLKQYHKILKQRNQLLKSCKSQDMELLEVWDNQLVQYGNEIIDKRKKFIAELDLVARKIHLEISGNQETLSLVYECNVTQDVFLKKLESSRQRDIIRGNTSYGPHKDDLNFMINDVSARVYGSQGQQRTIVLAMKLAEIEMMEKYLGEKPILLLDDVLSELDSKRQEYLFNYTQNTQTLITCTGIEQSVWKNQKIGKLYKVANGIIKEEKH